MPGIVNTDPLFVGLTRPPMLFGASYSFTVLNGLTCMMSYIVTSDIRFIAAMFPIHGLGYYMCLKEPLFIELWKVRAEKCSRSPNRLYHGANSYDVY